MRRDMEAVIRQANLGREDEKIAQLYFVDKDREDGASELYSISEFATPTSENVRKSYLMGKYGATPDLMIEEVD